MAGARRGLSLGGVAAKTVGLFLNLAETRLLTIAFRAKISRQVDGQPVYPSADDNRQTTAVTVINWRQKRAIDRF